MKGVNKQMIKKIKNIMTITLTILLIFTSTSFAEEGFSVPQEETSAIFSLPENTVKGQFSGELKGNTRTNLVPKYQNWTQIGNYSIIEDFKTQVVVSDNSNKLAYVSLNVKQNTDYALKIEHNGNIAVFNEDASSSLYGYTTSQEITFNTGSNSKVLIYLRNINATNGTYDFNYPILEEGTVAGNFIIGTKSTYSVRLTSVGKNLFDINNIKSDGNFKVVEKTNNSFTIEADSSIGQQVLNINPNIKFKPNVQYTMSGNSYETVETKNLRISFVYTDGTETTMSAPTTTTAYFSNTSAINKTISHISYRMSATGSGQTILTNFQLEEGTTATDYVKHEKSEVYVDVPFNDGELTRVPNGSADSVDLNTGIATQRNKKYVLQSGDFTNLTTILTNVDLVRVRVSDILPDSSNLDTIGKTLTTFGNEIQQADRDNVSSVGSYYTVYTGTLSDIQFIVAKGTYASLAEAQADLAGIELIYQLAEEQTYELPTTPLICYPNGTRIIEPAVQDVGVYNGGITISNIALPIVSDTLEVKKIENNGVRTIVDTTEITVSADGKTFTINGAGDGEAYEFTYQYPEELTTIPTTTYSVPIDQTGQINGNTNMINQHNDLIDLILQEIQTLKEEIVIE